MINANELRLGNLISYENTTHIVTEISRTLIRSYWIGAKEKEISNDYICEYKEIDPIPLTEEWLLKFGFEKDKDILGSYTKKIKGEIKPRFRFHTQYPRKKDKFLLATEIYYFEHIIFVQGDCKYVHQLQNLFFALNGEELQLN